VRCGVLVSAPEKNDRAEWRGEGELGIDPAYVPYPLGAQKRIGPWADFLLAVSTRPMDDALGGQKTRSTRTIVFAAIQTPMGPPPPHRAGPRRELLFAPV
jgi:hypothetical protein